MSKKIDIAAWTAVLITTVSGLIAVTVQWGVVTAKLDNVEKRLDEMIFETRSVRSEYQDIQKRLSVLEGRAQAGKSP